MMFAATGKQTGISVIADDTDVFVLLSCHYLAQKLSIPVVMESLVKYRFAVDIRGTVQRKNALDPYLIGGHALSGCDTVGCYFGISKGKVVKALWDGYTLPSLGDTNAELPDVVQESNFFIAACYGFPQRENIKTARQKMWKKRIGKSSKSVVKVSSLPLTAVICRERQTSTSPGMHLGKCTGYRPSRPFTGELWMVEK